MITLVTDQLRRQLDRPVSLAAFQTGRTKHACLAAFTHPAQVLHALETRDPDGAKLRSEITRALILSSRTHVDPIWLAMLTIAFKPTLLIVACDLAQGAEADREAADMDVIHAFFDAVETLPLDKQGEYAPLSLQLHLWRRVRQKQARQYTRDAWETLVDPQSSEEEHLTDTTPEDDLLRSESTSAVSTDLLTQLAQGVDGHDRDWIIALIRSLGSEPLDGPPPAPADPEAQLRARRASVLLESLLDRLPIKELARRAFRDLSDDELTQEVERLRGQRRRLVQRLRKCVRRNRQRMYGLA